MTCREDTIKKPPLGVVFLCLPSEGWLGAWFAMGEMSWAMKLNEAMIPDWQPMAFWWTIAEVTGPTGIRG